jgi:hypothetical protein
LSKVLAAAVEGVAGFVDGVVRSIKLFVQYFHEYLCLENRKLKINIKSIAAGGQIQKSRQLLIGLILIFFLNKVIYLLSANNNLYVSMSAISLSVQVYRFG